MNAVSAWKYVNKGLMVILTVFLLGTITSIIYLSQTLLHLDSLISSGSQSVRTALSAQRLYTGIIEAETNVRGYLITSRPEHLASYEAAIKPLPAIISAIKTDPKLNLTDTQRGSLAALSTSKLKVMKDAVAAHQAGNTDALQAISATGRGTELTGQIRAQVTDISSTGLGGLGERQRQSHDNLRRALVVAGGLSVFVLGICGLLSWYFRRSLLQERALENTKSEFLSLASHQLRTPATNVKQYVGLLLEGYLGDLSDKQKDALKIAYRNNELEIRIMNDLLDVAKLDLQRIQLHKQRVNVVSIVKQVMREYDQHIVNRGQTLVLKAPPELMAVVDRAYFKGVIEKLVDNAIKYSREKTRITVKVRVIQDNNMFEVVVRDRGLGIQKREFSSLFMKFSRLTNEFSANSEGSGLGLYWVKQVMELHGGSVLVASQEGRGSKFTVRAPIS